MKRLLVALLGITLLTLVGGVLMAQNSPGSDSPTDPSVATPPLTTSQPDAPAATDSSMHGMENANTESTTNTATADPPAQPSQPPESSGGSQKSGLPKTASPVPFVLVFGATALGAMLGLRAYRLRRAG
jgi:hypothetical protein